MLHTEARVFLRVVRCRKMKIKSSARGNASLLICAMQMLRKRGFGYHRHAAKNESTLL